MSNKPIDVRVRTPDRSQVTMRIGSPDELIGKDHPARLIWQVSGTLDLSAFYEPIKARDGVVGRDATDPRLLVALWLYASTRGVGSARELDRLCKESKPYQWLCGDATVNYHGLSDFRVQHAAALNDLFTSVIATLVDKKLIRVYRITQDGMRVRACAGASSFRRKERLEKLLEESKAHLEELSRHWDDPAGSGGVSARQKAARKRAARERQRRIEQALERLPKLQEQQEQQEQQEKQEKQEKLKKKVSRKDQAKGKVREPRASTTDPEARVMKMPDGGFRPAVNVPWASDPVSRAIVGVAVVSEGVDTGQAPPMRDQVQQRSGQKVVEHLVDGGSLKLTEIEQAADQPVRMYVPAKPPRNKEQRGSEYQPRPEDSEVLKAWRQRMGSEEGKTIYKQRASTSETVNADLRCYRGLGQLTVRGLGKATCAALWCALAYNLMHFGAALLS